ncbi:MAG: GAF domain-containing protein [Vicinamibacterales bacterium]
MSETFEAQLKRTLGSIVERLQSNLTEHVTSAVEEINTAAATERTAAVADAAAAAEKDVTSRLEAEFATRADQLKAEARAEGFQAGVKEAQAEAQAKHDEFAARSRAELDAAQHASRQASLDADTARARIVELQQERDNHARALVDASAQAVAQVQAARAEAFVESEVRFQTLLDSLRSIDAATSLTHTLDALVTAARPQADRLALFLLRGDSLWSWSQTGFDALHDFGAPTEFALAHTGILADAVRTGAPQSVTGADSRRPAFAGAASHGSTFIAVPLLMNGEAIGVLCGEQSATGESGVRLTFVYDVLARHAARVLESLTALRLANVSAHSAVAAPHH